MAMMAIKPKIADAVDALYGKREIARVFCPNLRQKGICLMRMEIARAVDAAKNLADATRKSPPTVVLFNEAALCYRFDIKEPDVLREIGIVQKALPKDMWIAVAFSVFQTNGKSATDTRALTNEGYVFTSSGVLHQPKRELALSDFDVLKEYCDERGLDFEYAKKAWNDRVRNMELEHIGFPNVASPGGLVIEHRVCADVCTKPIDNENNLGAVVSAWGLDKKWLKDLAKNRAFVVANDARGNEHSLFYGGMEFRNSPSFRIDEMKLVPVVAEDMAGFAAEGLMQGKGGKFLNGVLRKFSR